MDNVSCNENCKLEIIKSEFLKKEDIQWDSLIHCTFYKENRPYPISLPAGFLKKIGLLSNIDLGNEKYYYLDFKNFKRSNKTIDDLFSEYEETKKKPVYGEMFEYCKHLYRASTGRKNDYDKEEHQAKDQFVNEFKDFCTRLGFNNFLDKRLFSKENYNKKYVIVIRDLFKLFIMFRGIRIEGIDNILNSTIEHLPDEVKIINLYSVLDGNAIVSLDNKNGLKNDELLKRWYSLIWINMNEDNNDFYYIIDIIVKISIIMEEYLLTNDIYKKGFLTSNDRYFFIKQYIKAYFEKEKNNMHKYLNKNIDIYGYYIIKIFIDSEIKKRRWKKIIIDIDDTKTNLDIKNIDENKLVKLKKMIKDIKVDNADELLNLLSSRNTDLKKAEKDFILDWIFPNSKLRKAKQLEKLKHNLPKIILISIIYIMIAISVNRYNLSNIDVYKKNFLYIIIISAKLYFGLSNINLDIIKNIDKYIKMDSKGKTINTILNKICKNNSELDSVYIMIVQNIIIKYGCLYNLGANDDINGFYDISNLLYKEECEFLEEMKELVYSMV